VQLNNLPQVKRLIESFNDLNFEIKDNQMSLLHFAALNNNPEMIDLLIKHKVNVDSVNIHKDSALHIVSLKYHFMI